MTETRQVSAPTSWPAVSLAIGAGVLAAFQVGKVIIALPEVRESLGMDLATAGVLLSSYTIVGALLGVVTGRVVDKLGRERVLVACLVILGAGALLGAAAPTTALLLASRMVEGFGFMGVVIAAPALINQQTAPRDRRIALGMWGIYMPLGQVLIMLAAPFVLSLVGWRGLWAANGLLLVGYAAVATVVLRGGLREHHGRSVHHAPDSSSILRQRAPVLLALVFGFYSLQYLAVVGFLPTIYAEAGLSGATVGVLTAIVVFGNVVGNVVGGWLLHRGVIAGTLMIVGGVAMGASAVVVYSDAAGFGLSFAAAVAFATFGGLIPSSVFVAIPLLAPSPGLIGRANGLVVQASNIGSIIGPPLVGLLAGQVGSFELSPLVLSTSAAVGCLAAVVIRAMEREIPAR
jgi:MFS family permease